MNPDLLRASLLIGAVVAQTLIIALCGSLFLKHANHHRIVMTDVLYLIATIGFFGLMILFIRACDKV